MKDRPLISSVLDTPPKPEKYDTAAAQCPSILGPDADLWESWIYAFAEARQLKAIAGYIPVMEPTLSDTIYELVLAHFLMHDHQVGLAGSLSRCKCFSRNVFAAHLHFSRLFIFGISCCSKLSRASPPVSTTSKTLSWLLKTA